MMSCSTKIAKEEAGMKTIMIIIVLMLGSAPYLSAQDESRIFPAPSVEGRRLDLCFVWGAQCGQPAADAFCQAQGFDAASVWEPENDIGAATPTIVLTGGAVCSHPDCDGFRTITCARADQAATVSPVDVLPWTTQDVIDERIDVQAQYALMRMFTGEPHERVVASHIMSAIKEDGTLGGIYQEDQQVPALRAQALGYGWWKILPPANEDQRVDGICMTEPVPEKPVMVMRKGSEKNRAAYDGALMAAWESCGVTPSQIVRPYKTTLPPKQPEPKETTCPTPASTGTLTVSVFSGNSPIGGAQASLGVPAQPIVIGSTNPSGQVTLDSPGSGYASLDVIGPKRPDGSSAYGPSSKSIFLEPDCAQSTVVQLFRIGTTTVEHCDPARRDKALDACESTRAFDERSCIILYANRIRRCGSADMSCQALGNKRLQECYAEMTAAHESCRERAMSTDICGPENREP
jgi:hypothetical protein